MRALLVLVMAVVLAGCSTSPKQAADAGFLTKHVSTNLPVTRTYANLREGFRYCDFADLGVLDCRPPEKGGAVFCRVYAGGASGKTGRLLGTIQLSPEPTGTNAVLRIHGHAANKEEILMAWEIFMSGKVREACPP